MDDVYFECSKHRATMSVAACDRMKKQKGMLVHHTCFNCEGSLTMQIYNPVSAIEVIKNAELGLKRAPPKPLRNTNYAPVATGPKIKNYRPIRTQHG
jgi:hypothetical protein